MRSVFAALIFALVASTAGALPAQDQVTDFPADTAKWFINEDGSCVQCSIGMCGSWQNTPSATFLLWDSEYGARVRGGSSPSRVEAYCDRRKIPAYNITGSETYEWMKWASRTGRMSAIGCYSSHFQTLLYHDPAKGEWYVKNNWGASGGNNIKSHNVFSDAQFRRHHEASGKWVVILKTPPPPMKPLYVAWWK
jgi:hypothetical protein